MPIVRINGANHYFAHVPKCSGQSVEYYLRARFGSLALSDDAHFSPGPERTWSRCSPQHIPWECLQRILPTDWIASCFTMVRHPLRRLVSEFNVQSAYYRSLPPGMTIDEWFDDYLAAGDAAFFAHDCHLTPNVAFFPEDCAIFRLEDGHAPLVAHLDGLAGNADGPRAVGHENKLRMQGPEDFRDVPVTRALVDRVAAYYAEDFSRLGYEPDAFGEAMTKVRLNRKRLFGTQVVVPSAVSIRWLGRRLTPRARRVS